MIPDLETSDVHLKTPPAKVQREHFDQQLVLGEDRVAGGARFAVAWTTPDRSDADMRQATEMDSASDQEAKSFCIQQHDCPSTRRRCSSNRPRLSAKSLRLRMMLLPPFLAEARLERLSLALATRSWRLSIAA